MGFNATASNTNTIAIGTGTIASSTSSISIGTGNTVSGANSGAIGDPSIVSGSASYSLGNDNNINTNNTFDIGNNVTTTAANSVILGNASAYTTAGLSETYTSSTINGTTYNYAGGTTNTGVVSVGSETGTRRIQNVSAGLISTTSTDAVNGSQLYALVSQISSSSGGTGTGSLTYKANGNSYTTSLSNGLDFTNGTNTTSSVDANGVVTYDLNSDITGLNSVTATTVKGDTITAGDTVTIDNSGISDW